MSSNCDDTDASLRRLVSLCVEHADGTIDIVQDGGVSLVAGANVSFNTEFDDEDILVELDPEAGGEDPYYRQKFNALAYIAEGEVSSGEELDIRRTAWVFSDRSIFTATVNQTPAEDVSGAIFITGDACFTAGEFESDLGAGYPQDGRYVIPEYGSSSTLMLTGAELVYTDICAPCLDCPQYYRLEEYINRIEAFYDYIFALSYDNSTGSVPAHPDGGVRETTTGTLQQFMAVRKYWDYLVHNSTVKLSAQAYGQSVVVAGFYRNISDRAIGDGADGVTFQFLLSFKKVDSGGNVTAWSGISQSITDVIPLVRQERCSADIGGLGVTFPGSSQIQIEMVSGADIAAGAEVYADVAVTLLGALLTNDPLYSYRVDIDLTVSHTHLGPVVSNNPVSRDTSVYFRPPEPESSA